MVSTTIASRTPDDDDAVGWTDVKKILGKVAR